MIHIVSAANAAAYDWALEQDFRLRHEIYVGERKWMDLAKPDGRERDQFDTPDAIYLFAIEGGKVLGGSRLVPSLKPHLLSEVFPTLAIFTSSAGQSARWACLQSNWTSVRPRSRQPERPSESNDPS